MPDQSDAQNDSPAPGLRLDHVRRRDARFSAIEKNLMKVAEELGTFLGTAERKTADFIAQRDIKDHLVKIRDTAARLLAQVDKARERSGRSLVRWAELAWRMESAIAPPESALDGVGCDPHP